MADFLESTSPDLLIVTALTEEAQVVNAVLAGVTDDAPSKQMVEDTRVLHHRYRWDGGTLRVWTATAHDMGAVPMGAWVGRMLSHIRPRAIALVGIAAALETGLALGDVPVSSWVVKGDDIAVDSGRLESRSREYPTDPRLRRAFGELRTDFAEYSAWQQECEEVIRTIVPNLTAMRSVPIRLPEEVRQPHLIVGKTAGTPFLLRDPNFRDSLRGGSSLESAVIFATPLDPKLVSAEMEAHGFMEAALNAQIPAIVVKGISDDGDGEKAELERSTGGFYRAYACSNSVLALLHAARNLAGTGTIVDPSGAAIPASDKNQGAAHGVGETVRGRGGAQTLLLLDDIFIVVKSVSTSSDGTWSIHAGPQNPEVEAELSELASGPGVFGWAGSWNSAPSVVQATYELRWSEVRVVDAKRMESETVVEWNISLEGTGRQSDPLITAGTYGTRGRDFSADEVAELCCKKILLGHAFEGADHTSMIVESIVNGCTAPPLELARDERGVDLGKLRLLFVREILRCRVVDRILRLELVEDYEEIRVSFRGRRNSPYSNRKPSVIEVEGPLVPF